MNLPAATPLTCIARIDETAQATTFELAAPTSAPDVFAYHPGQFIVLSVPIEGVLHHRAYSLSSTPTRPHSLAVTVKRVEGGRVSNWLIDNLQPTHAVLASPPSGHFHLREDALPPALVLVSAGSGITPMMSMLRFLADRRENLPVYFLHCARQPEDLIFAQELAALAATHPWLHLCPHFSAEHGRLSQEALHARLGRLDPAAEAYLCGPEAFMQTAGEGLMRLGIAEERIFRERFGGPSPTSEASGETFGIEVPQFGKSLTVGAGETLLDALEREGLPLLGACRSGVCGSCKCKVEAGTVTAGGDASLISAEEAAQGIVLACSSHAQSDLTLSW